MLSCSRVPVDRFPARGGLRAARPCRRTRIQRPFAGDGGRNGAAAGQPECGGRQVVSDGKWKCVFSYAFFIFIAFIFNSLHVTTIAVVVAGR